MNNTNSTNTTNTVVSGIKKTSADKGLSNGFLNSYETQQHQYLYNRIKEPKEFNKDILSSLKSDKMIYEKVKTIVSKNCDNNTKVDLLIGVITKYDIENEVEYHSFCLFCGYLRALLKIIRVKESKLEDLEKKFNIEARKKLNINDFSTNSTSIKFSVLYYCINKNNNILSRNSQIIIKLIKELELKKEIKHLFTRLY
jgi:hypothetical protein